MTVVVGGFFVTGEGGGCVSSGLGGVTVVGSSGGGAGAGFGVATGLVGVTGVVGRGGGVLTVGGGVATGLVGVTGAAGGVAGSVTDAVGTTLATVGGAGGGLLEGATAVRGAADVGKGVVSVTLAGVIRALCPCNQAIVTPIAAITVAANSATATRTWRRLNPWPSGDWSPFATATRSSSDGAPGDVIGVLVPVS